MKTYSTRKAVLGLFPGLTRKVTVLGALSLALLGYGGSGLAQTCPSCRPAPAGITNWYPGDFNANDLLTANVGAPTNVTLTPAEVQNGFTFAGNGNIQFGPSVGNFGTSDFTVAFWVKSSTLGTQAIIENRANCFGGVQFWSIRINGVVTAELNNGSTDFPIAGSINVADGNYHHVAMVRSLKNLAVYVDGQLDTTLTGPTRFNVGSPGLAQAGTSVCTGLDGTQDFTGQLDEIQLYNKALTATQVNGLFKAGHLGNCK